MTFLETFGRYLFSFGKWAFFQRQALENATQKEMIDIEFSGMKQLHRYLSLLVDPK